MGLSPLGAEPTPAEWYAHYKEKIESKMKFNSEKTRSPTVNLKCQDAMGQFLIYFKRNLLSKLADRQFMAISLLVAPLLAVILGFFSKYVVGR